MDSSNPRIRVDTPETKAKRLTNWYRETFKTDEDLAVLFDILNECGWIVNDPFPAKSRPGWSAEFYMARHTLAMYILTRLGAMQEFNGVDMLRAMKKLPFEKEI
jgi:hypothetical protein